MTFYRISYPRNLHGSLHPHPLCGIVFELSVLDDKISRIDWLAGNGWRYYKSTTWGGKEAQGRIPQTEINQALGIIYWWMVKEYLLVYL